MKRYVFKRILLILPLLLVLSFIIFFMLRLNGTDAALSYLTASGIAPTDEAIKNAKSVLGLDKPVFTQYLAWLSGAIRLDFGVSFITGRDVFSDMSYYFANSLKIIALGLFFTIFVSLLLGVLSAIFKDKFIDFAVRFISFIGVCVPNFWLGFILISIFSLKFELLPPFGAGSFLHLLMPAFAISFMSIAINARLIRANMLENLNSRHVLYAKMRSVSGVRILFSHVLKNALIPIITALGMHFGELLGAAIVVENVFAYPGVGSYIINAVVSNDYPVILAFMLLMAVVFILSNLIIDLIYALIDPRIRLGYK